MVLDNVQISFHLGKSFELCAKTPAGRSTYSRKLKSLFNTPGGNLPNVDACLCPFDAEPGSCQCGEDELEGRLCLTCAGYVHQLEASELKVRLVGGVHQKFIC